MQEDNTDIVRRGFEAWNRRDDEAVQTYFSDEIEIDASDRVLNPAVYRGLEGARRFRSEIAETWDGFHVEIEEALPAGERVVVLVRVSGQGRASGAAVDARSAWVARVDAGKVASLRLYRDRAEALAAISA
jgi:ketosteroid isomerase-like protein